MLCSVPAWAGNIAISGVRLDKGPTEGTRRVCFDIRWDDSWRVDLPGPDQAPPHNYDAAWVFVKFRTPRGGGWRHASLGSDPAEHVLPAHCALSAGRTDDRVVGVFLYRKANGRGSFEAKQVGLTWRCAADGVGAGDEITVKPMAIEMVYVPEGAYWLGDGRKDLARFYEGGSGSKDNSAKPFCVAGEDAIEVGDSAGRLYYENNVESFRHISDRAGPIPASFPKGFKAFFAMKYELSMGEYVEFLNLLLPAQHVARYPYYCVGRNRLKLEKAKEGIYRTPLPRVACDWLCWADVAAYLDWAGLRPLTELEYEKACRGPEKPVPGEYAWGTTRIVPATGIANEGQPDERAANADANCVILVKTEPGAPSQKKAAAAIELDAPAGKDPIDEAFETAKAPPPQEQKAKPAADSGFPTFPAPLRVGCLGPASGGTREATGAGYYGMRELSGSVWERVVTVGTAYGRMYDGRHGDGRLDEYGEADVAGWPAGSEGWSGYGTGFRGGSSVYGAEDACASSRVWAQNVYTFRNDCRCGIRGARTAPEIPPAVGDK